MHISVSLLHVHISISSESTLNSTIVSYRIVCEVWSVKSSTLGQTTDVTLYSISATVLVCSQHITAFLAG